MEIHHNAYLVASHCIASRKIIEKKEQEIVKFSVAEIILDKYSVTEIILDKYLFYQKA